VLLADGVAAVSPIATPTASFVAAIPYVGADDAVCARIDLEDGAAVRRSDPDRARAGCRRPRCAVGDRDRRDHPARLEVNSVEVASVPYAVALIAGEHRDAADTHRDVERPLGVTGLDAERVDPARVGPSRRKPVRTLEPSNLTRVDPSSGGPPDCLIISCSPPAQVWREMVPSPLSTKMFLITTAPWYVTHLLGGGVGEGRPDLARVDPVEHLTIQDVHARDGRVCDELHLQEKRGKVVPVTCIGQHVGVAKAMGREARIGW